MLQPWFKCIVVKIEDATHNTRRFWLQIPELEVFDFEPGQFITFDLPIHEQRNKRWRSYSISSAPDGTNIIELVIVLMEDGLGTPYLFNEVKVGSELILRGPQGKFTMPVELNKDLYLICTGTGIAPFRSMVHYIAAHDIAHQNIHIIFGCRTLGDSLYEAELKALEQTLPNFFFHPCFSRETELQSGQYKGYVHHAYQQLIANNKEVDGSLPPAYFYFCGWKNMVDEAKQNILALGYDKKDIHLELYG
ncbi:MAG: FAD-dependent oxidoreductase [Sphingobacteriia bacterium]|nr:MAG: FAD-dependent oxidoreductase [Sphingobacteriia bacterium]TAG30179.1 MAG: FAD-dependent oxidoreductase [Sphingobacteriia bacterium]TAH06439.1 MAG: FAD-dependent oxidoreductase [Sphingobacteriia bacterium]